MGELSLNRAWEVRMNPRFKSLGVALWALTVMMLCALAQDGVAGGQLTINTNPNEWCAAAALGLTLMAASRDRK